MKSNPVLLLYMALVLLIALKCIYIQWLSIYIVSDGVRHSCMKFILFTYAQGMYV